MFTRIIDPFNNQAWNKTPQRHAITAYIPKTESITKKKKKKLTSNANTSCDEAFADVSDTWTIKTEQNEFDKGIHQPEIDIIEVDDFVMV